VDNDGNVITFSRPYTRKLLMLRHLDARGVEPVSIDVRLRVSADVLLEGTHEQADRRGSPRMAPDVITFVITSPAMASVWKRSNSQYFTVCFRDQTGRQRRITTKETDRKKAQRLADEYEKPSRIKRSLRQAQAVLDRLHEELSGERVVRTSLREFLDDWFDGKKAETAPSTMTFYRSSLAKFLQFLGQRSDNAMTEVTKQDVVAFRNSLITQVSAKTANHDLKALKMLFKSARRDGVVTEDPTEFVETVWRERRPKIKRPFTLPELLRVLDLAADEWRSMIFLDCILASNLEIQPLRWKV